ncbi:hypothetical protein V6N13_072842 [Hibiscus sabdariffa]|uniref:Uncharacterized protein n=1 Tax=Hibiscus sabdariffa TaxID=183260 RepID=A0ABR2E7B6_9ROSI
MITDDCNSSIISGMKSIPMRLSVSIEVDLCEATELFVAGLANDTSSMVEEQGTIDELGIGEAHKELLVETSKLLFSN